MKVVKVFTARSQKSGFQSLEKSIMAETENGKIYCTHRQSTAHGFNQILRNSTPELLNSLIRDGHTAEWFECVAATTKKGEVIYKQI